MAGIATRRRCTIDLYAWGRGALTFCRMSVDEFDSLTNRIGWRAAFEVLLLAIARKCGDKVEKWERAGALGIPWQKKRWSSLTSLQSSYNDAVRRSFLEQFRGRSQCSRCSSRTVCFDSPVTTARRGDRRIGKGNRFDVAKGMSVGNANKCMANGSHNVAPCTFIQSPYTPRPGLGAPRDPSTVTSTKARVECLSSSRTGTTKYGDRLDPSVPPFPDHVCWITGQHGGRGGMRRGWRHNRLGAR